ncbi:glycosyltransferase family 2 protein [Chitinophaga sancti]|uniref:Glycosyltransferase family 2 protein n=2 Tax=Chitinophaga sancti TaxID=1004 RepID=A0ABZ0XKW7_9BACT|nr:glycosyltransferase family 2 protein [Chitinophaga sancti]WQD63486.1 glycosyltransferase family 2 protein [Chitinophaga sancti]WQG90888.1 glycosyltransferase family 2 protein [Chitinophaga sancti]
MMILFYTSLFILFYNYIGYGFLVGILVACKRLLSRDPKETPAFMPAVTLIVAAYNEAAFIPEKIKNTLELDYPADKLEIIFITDGSNDGSEKIVQQYSRIRGMHEQERRGKTAAINRAMQTVQTPVVIFCDANTLLNAAAVKNIVRHYQDPKTGGVAGEKKVMQAGNSGAAGTEGIYWKYESVLKRLDAALYSVVGAAGELFSVRTTLFTPVEPEVILDDFIISLRVNQMGYRIAYAPDAFAMETPSAGITEEHKRKIRISAGGFQSIVMLRALLNVFRYPLLSFQYISHRVLRWTLSPLSLPILFISAAVLAFQGAGSWYQFIFVAQLIFYILAVIGFFLAKRDIKFKPCYIPFYFLFMNVAIYEGFFRYIRKQQSAVWEKARRETAVMNA